MAVNTGICSTEPDNPSWLPPGSLWAHPSRKNDSLRGREMSPQDFLSNERAVLRAAYVFAGINPDTHISDEFCLRKSSFRSEPFRVPLNSQLLKTFHPQAISGRNKKTTEISFIPIEEGMEPINGDYSFNQSINQSINQSTKTNVTGGNRKYVDNY